MVALKKRNMYKRAEKQLGEFISSPNEGHDLEYLIDMLKQLQSVEAQLDKAREKLIMRCPEFNNKEAIRMFDPPEDKTENMHFFNVKKAFKLVTLGIETYQANQIVQRFDSNFDEELSFSDITDIFKTTSTPLNQELERRTVFAPVEQGKTLNLSKQCLEYVRDIFEHLLQAAAISDKIRVALIKRPKFGLKRAL